MKHKITYGQLIKKLLSIGYTEKRISGSHTILFKEQNNSTIVLPAFNKNKIIEPYILMTIRKNIVEKGVLNADDFIKLVSGIL